MALGDVDVEAIVVNVGYFQDCRKRILGSLYLVQPIDGIVVKRVISI